MKIKTIKIKNFKCLGPEEIKIDFSENIVVLVGENNVGKSAVLNALKYYFKGTKTIPNDLFFNGKTDKENAITVTVKFNELSKEDTQHKSLKGNVYKNTWTLQKNYYYKDEKPECYYRTITQNGKWKNNPAGWRTITDDLWTDEKMQIPFVEAVKDVSEEASGSKSSFEQIFEMLVREELEGTGEFGDLQKAIEKFEKLIEKKEIPSIKKLEQDLNKKLKRMIPVTTKIKPETIDIKTPTPILLTDDNRGFGICPSNQGNGLQRVLIFSLLEIYAELKSPSSKSIGPKNLILIEEPEIYMHPQMERKISDTLYKIAEEGVAQVICTTHSPVFINISDKHKAFVRLTRDKENLLTIKQVDEIFSKPNREDNKKRLRMILNFDPSVNEIFFAKRVVLVEGDTEVAVFKEAAELLGLFNKPGQSHLRRDVTFVNCRGKWTIVAFQEVLNHFGIDYVVVHDKDEQGAEEGANARILSLLDNKETRRKMFDPKIEEQLGIIDSSKSKPFKALEKTRELAKKGKLNKVLGNYIKFAYGINK